MNQRSVLEEINSGTLVWGPTDNSEAALTAFNAQATELIDILDQLVGQGFIGNYRAHVESYTGNRYIDRVLITDGLTFKGQDKSRWPQ